MNKYKYYQKCMMLIENDLLSNKEENNKIFDIQSKQTTFPLKPWQDIGDVKYLCNQVFYISDIHLVHKIQKAFPKEATNKQIIVYVEKIVQDLVSDIEHAHKPIILFGGDISSSYSISKIFYRKFVKQMRALKNTLNLPMEFYVYAVLGNHEFWDFKTPIECYSAYHELFNSLGIHFLQNKIWSFGEFSLPQNSDVKIVDGCVEDIEVYRDNDRQKIFRYSNTLIVGGVGFAGYNYKFNADNGIYKGNFNREQEIKESNKWEELYNHALKLARKTKSVLIVLTHNPLSDWKEDGKYDTECIYFSGHDHQDYLFHDDENIIHVFADNQIGYYKECIRLKEAYIYQRTNPFVNYTEGYHEISEEDYLRFNDYRCVRIRGIGYIEREIQNKKAKLYMIKYKEYYGFFLITGDTTYLCVGGRIQPLYFNVSMEQLNIEFPKMIDKCLKILSPYREVQEQVANYVKSFGGDGRIHGCIIDIDISNHIFILPSDGSFIYYNSPQMGLVKTYNSILKLLDNHNQELADKYRKIANIMDIHHYCTDNTEEWIKVDIKNSIYVISNRMEQYQKLFENKILRSWNPELLLKDMCIENK